MVSVKKITAEAIEGLKDEQNRKLAYEMLTFLGLIRFGSAMYKVSRDRFDSMMRGEVTKVTDATVGDIMKLYTVPPALRDFYNKQGMFKEEK